MYECEKDRQGGKDSHQREEIVGGASSFIAALMSPGTHRLETAVLFSSRPCQQILHSYWHTETHVHSEQITTYAVWLHTHTSVKRTPLWFDQWNLESTKQIFLETYWLKHLHLFEKLWSCCKVFCPTSWHTLKERGWAVQGCLLRGKHNRPQCFGPRPDSFCPIIITCPVYNPDMSDGSARTWTCSKTPHLLLEHSHTTQLNPFSEPIILPQFDQNS